MWTTSPYSRFAKKLSFPESSYYVEIMESARKKINTYFSNNFEGFSDIYIENYLRKFYDLKMIEYVAFRYSINMNIDHKYNVIMKDSTFQRNIYENDRANKKIRISFIILSVAATLIFTIRSLLRSIGTSEKLIAEDVIYVRKKPYPDLGLRDLITEELECRYNIKSIGAYIYDSKHREKFGNYFINAFEGGSRRALKAAAKAITDSGVTSRIGGINGLSYRVFLTLLADMYRANVVILLNGSIYFGVLVDKPFFILLSRYKRKEQKILGINESFMYPPFRSFDYNHLDIYYSMNDIDWNMQNIYGGEIKEHKNIEFFRKHLRTYSGGMSEELNILYKKYKNMVIIAPIQISETGYTQWGIVELNKFIESCLSLAKNNQKYLFVIKGKKNELSYLSSYLMMEIKRLNNVFVIFSTKPRELKFNQFEDLLKHTTLLVSMSHTSTTIWQALSHHIPVIAVNDSHQRSFLSDYDHLESSSDQLQESFLYWTHKSPDKLEKFIYEISKKVNLGGGLGYKYIAEDIYNIKSGES